jgi:hypothetical protein
VPPWRPLRTLRPPDRPAGDDRRRDLRGRGERRAQQPAVTVAFVFALVDEINQPVRGTRPTTCSSRAGATPVRILTAAPPRRRSRGCPGQEAITVEQTLPDQQTTCESVPDTGRAGRFSTGLEALPPTPDKLHRGKYSEGLEQFPASPDNRHPGRFSDGVERLPETPAKVRRGSFADAQH